jgi:hypothetical protein
MVVSDYYYFLVSIKPDNMASCYVRLLLLVIERSAYEVLYTQEGLCSIHQKLNLQYLMVGPSISYKQIIAHKHVFLQKH